jgi:UDP-N-acetylmuramoylalanine--D-glutamate ligase
VRLLARRGETVIGIDRGAPEAAEGLAGDNVEILLDGDRSEEVVDRVGCVVKSPGVPSSAPAVAAARDRGMPVIGEVELAWRLLPNRFVAVTGTNGKTTVSELLGHVWRTAGEPVAVAGNVGTALTTLVDEVAPDTTIVCEVSSFQLEDTDAFAPEAAVLLNLTPDHLDRHGSFEAYRDAKLRIFANQGPDDVAVYNGADPALADLDLGGKGRRVDFTARLGDFTLALPGPHNAQNAAAAGVTAEAMGIEANAIAEALRTFEAVPNRLERVAEIGGVTYVNDSKATNAAAAAAAIRSYDGGVRVILGGSLKGGDFAGLVEPVTERVTAAYLIGEAAPRLEAELAPVWDAGVAHRRLAGLAEAVRAAAADATAGEVVLLAPACASFDAYRDYEERGEHFRALVEELRRG